MSMTATVDHARRRILVRAEGLITVNEILAHLEEERGLGALSYSELIDGRGYSPDFGGTSARNCRRPSSSRRKLGPRPDRNYNRD